MKIAFKPTATIGKEQKTVNSEGKEVLMKAKGRHDPCVLPRAVPMVDACLLYTSPSPRDRTRSRMPSSA